MRREFNGGSSTTTRDDDSSTRVVLAAVGYSTCTRAVPLMHELALMESVVEEIAAHTGGARIAVVRLEVGRLAGVATDALRFCFEICAQGTAVAGASLQIVEVPARARCSACGVERAIESLVSSCACGSFAQQVLSGCELRLKDVEVI